ncbi:hypothetical protein QVD17_19298 [Tagetes erecta]|uniref:Uncharacterized protein n=1 Tax=Tagetes erecta TaxID=13708 RepID=A0AAD8KPG1_TARER|nr:hypothetical protein QVD17_19298 [Tagetes erecta]
MLHVWLPFSQHLGLDIRLAVDLCVGQNMRSMKKSPKVADESMFGEGNRPEFPNVAQYTREGLSSGFGIIYNIIKAPLTLLSCLSSHPHISGATDGVWVSGELARTSEANNLMVNDSMRYIILL